MNNIHILQFEYFDDFYEHNVFLKVHATFKHHYTGETMRYIQCDYVNDGEAETFFTVMNEADFEAYYERRIVDNEEIEEYVNNVAEGIKNNILDGLLG